MNIIEIIGIAVMTYALGVILIKYRKYKRDMRKFDKD